MQRTAILLIIILVLVALVIGVYFLLTSGAMKGNLANTATNTAQNNPGGTTNVQGMQTETLKSGSGNAAKAGDKVTIHYKTQSANGSKSSSLDMTTPFTFELGKGQMLEALDVGIIGMKVGEQRKITVPADLVASKYSFLRMPPGTSIIYTVDLLSIGK